MSRHHVRIYSIIYDENDSVIRPLVYAQNVSSQFMFWKCSEDASQRWRKFGAEQTYLLSHDDSISLDKKQCFQFKESAATILSSLPPAMFNELERLELKVKPFLPLHIAFAKIRQSFDFRYTVTNRQLGGGAYGRVCLGFNLAALRGVHQVACKIVNYHRSSWSAEKRDRFHKLGREVEILKTLSHVIRPWASHGSVLRLTLLQA